MALETFKSYDPKRPIKLYRNNKPLARQQQAKWTDPGFSATTELADLPKASVGLRITHGPSVAGTTLGYLKVSWYLKFRGQAYQQ